MSKPKQCSEVFPYGTSMDDVKLLDKEIIDKIEQIEIIKFIADYGAKQCLEYLYRKNCFSAETSTISIADFEGYIQGTYELKETRARQKLAEFRKNGWVDSKQIFQGDTKVWLTFVPQIENLAFQGDKGSKGYNVYEGIYSGINDILRSMLPLSPLLPKGERIQGDIDDKGDRGMENE